MGERAEHIARRLDVSPEGAYSVVIVKSETYLCYKQVLVVVPQDGVSAACIVEILGLERWRNPRHVDVIEVEQVEAICCEMVGIAPLIPPCGREHAAMELGAVLHIVTDREFACRSRVASERAREERGHKARKLQSRLHTKLRVVLILVSLKSCNGLKSASHLDAQLLRATEQVPVCPCHRCGGTKISCGVSALWLETYGVRLLTACVDCTVKESGILALGETDVGISQSC